MDGAKHSWGAETRPSPSSGKGIARWRASSAHLAVPFWMYLLASALDRVDRTAEALDTLNDALGQSEHMDLRWLACELSILRATLIARTRHSKQDRGPGAEAQRDLRRAFDIAAEIGSPSLRLRAANTLSPLLRDQGKAHEARDLVRTAYAAFNERLETADLAEARAILREP